MGSGKFEGWKGEDGMSEWKKVKLGESCTKIGSGATPKGGSTVYTSNGTSFIRSQNVYNLRFDYNGLTHINDEAAEKLKGVSVIENDILLNITGDSVARTCIVPNTILPARVNQHVAIIRAKSELLNQKYLNYYLASPAMQAYMLSLAVGKGASRNAITKLMIENFEVPCPSLEVQCRIVKILSQYDSLIENYQKQIKLLEESAQRLYKEWFVDFRFPGHENTKIVNGVPEGWKKGAISDVVTFFDSLRKPLSSMQRMDMDKKYPYYGAASVMDYVDNYLFDGIYVLLGEDGTVITKEGYPILQYVWGKFWVNNHAHVLQGKDKATTEYIYMMFKNTHIANLVTGCAQPKISQGRLSDKEILMPSDYYLSMWNNQTENIFKQIRILHDQIKLLTEARDRLLPKLMSFNCLYENIL